MHTRGIYRKTFYIFTVFLIDILTHQHDCNKVTIDILQHMIREFNGAWVPIIEIESRFLLFLFKFLNVSLKTLHNILHRSKSRLSHINAVIKFFQSNHLRYSLVIIKNQWLQQPYVILLHLHRGCQMVPLP